MNNNATLDKMREMRLLGMANAFQTCITTSQTGNFTPDELLAHLLDAEWNDRQLRKMERHLRAAKFRYRATIEEIDFATSRGLDKNLILRLADCSFLDRKENLLLTGPTGTGKSFLASAIGNQACGRGYRVRYFNCAKLFSAIKMETATGSYNKFIDRLERQDLLILDDFCLQPLTGPERLALLEIIEDRHGRKSTIIASQLPVENWYEVIGEKTIADAILDRLVHDAHHVQIQGESMRKRKRK
jgi:DNA replication protein DnaC